MSDTATKLPQRAKPVPTTGVAEGMLRPWLTDNRAWYLDPLAKAFVNAAREGFSAERWASLEELADLSYEGRSVAVR